MGLEIEPPVLFSLVNVTHWRFGATSLAWSSIAPSQQKPGEGHFLTVRDFKIISKGINQVFRIRRSSPLVNSVFEIFKLNSNIFPALVAVRLTFRWSLPQFKEIIRPNRIQTDLTLHFSWNRVLCVIWWIRWSCET